MATGLIVLWLFFSLGVGWVSNDKTLGFWGGFLLSLFLSPFVGFIITLFYPLKKDVENRIKMGKPSLSIADELTKLSNLKLNGTITEEEFQTMKGNLLR